MRLLAVVLAAALLVPAAALGQAPDYGPVDVLPNPQHFVVNPAAAWTTSPAGTFALTWYAQNTAGDGYVFGARSPLTPGAAPVTLTGPAKQPAAFASLTPATGFRANGTVVMAGPSGARSSARLGTTAGAPTQALPAPRTLAFPGASANAAVLGMRSDGGAVIAVSLCATTSCGRRTISLVTRSNTGQLGAPVVLTGGGVARPVAIAVNARGDAFTAWVRGSQVQGRLRTAGGSVGPVVTLGAAENSFAPLAVTITGNRRVVVAWENQTVHEGSVVSSNAVFSVAVSQDGRNFTSTKTLATQTDRVATPAPGIVATLASDNTTWLGWTFHTGGVFSVRAARVISTGPQNAATISAGVAGDAAISDIAGGPDHRIAAVWVAYGAASPTQDSTVLASVFPHEYGPWGPPETVAAHTGVFEDEQRPVVSIDSPSGIALFAWVQGSGPPADYAEQLALRTRAIP